MLTVAMICSGSALHRPVEAGAEQCVDDHVGLAE